MCIKQRESDTNAIRALGVKALAGSKIRASVTNQLILEQIPTWLTMCRQARYGERALQRARLSAGQQAGTEKDASQSRDARLEFCSMQPVADYGRRNSRSAMKMEPLGPLVGSIFSVVTRVRSMPSNAVSGTRTEPR